MRDTAKELVQRLARTVAGRLRFGQERKQKTERPSKLFDLTALQRAANRLYGYTAKQTLDLAQAFYEKKLITYPRTDSRYLTEDMARTVLEVIACSLKLPPFDSLLRISTQIPFICSITTRCQTTTPLSLLWNLITRIYPSYSE